MELSVSAQNSMRGWYFPFHDTYAGVINKIMINPSIDFTNACNLNCPYCYIEEKNSIRKKRKPSELTYDETIRIIDEFASLGAKTINIVGAGEPTIDFHFYEIIEYIFSHGMTTVLFTNGIKLAHDETMIDFLFEHDVTIVLKMNSFEAQTQNLMAGRDGYHEQTTKALELLIQKGFNASSPSRLSINCVACKGNLHELPAIHQFCRENNVYPIMGDFIPTGRTESGHFVAENAISMFKTEEQESVKKILTPLSPSETMLLWLELAKIDELYGIVRKGCSAYYGGGICTQILGLYVDISGIIWPCVARSERVGSFNELKSGILGNIRNGDSIGAIWNTHPYMQKIREHFDGGCPYKAPLAAQ